jgi:predicted nucleic acid-binding protein
VIVVDTNVIGYLFLPSQHRSQSEQVLAVDSDWVAPLLWQSEFRNVLALYLRHNHLTLSEIYNILRKAEELMRGKARIVNSLHVINLVAASNCSAYDCEFVALAHELNVPLVTFDKKILREFGDTAVSPQQFLTNC